MYEWHKTLDACTKRMDIAIDDPAKPDGVLTMGCLSWIKA